MNQNPPTNGGPDAFGRTNNTPARASGAPPLPGGDRTPPLADPPKYSPQGAQDTANPSMDRAGAVARRSAENITAERVGFPAHADGLRESREEWIEGARTTIRSNPIGYVAAALALGAVIMRITR